MFLKVKDFLELGNGPLKEDELSQYDVVTDESIIDVVLRACARGERQRRIVMKMFSPVGAGLSDYRGDRGEKSLYPSFPTLLGRLDQFFTERPFLGLEIIVSHGPEGDWWDGRFYIRQRVINKRVMEAFSDEE